MAGDDGDDDDDDDDDDDYDDDDDDDDFGSVLMDLHLNFLSEMVMTWQ